MPILFRVRAASESLRDRGTKVQDVNALLRQYAQMSKMFKQMGKGGMAKQMMRGGMAGLMGGSRSLGDSGRDAGGFKQMTELQDQLDEITANTRRLVQAERLAVASGRSRSCLRAG